MKRKLDHKTHIISVKYAEERRSDNESMIGFAMDPKNQHLLCRSSFRVKTGLAGQTDRAHGDTLVPLYALYARRNRHPGQALQRRGGRDEDGRGVDGAS